MAAEFNITAADKFFLGEDKFIDFIVTGENGLPMDVTGLPLEWSLKKKDKDPDPPIIGKSTTSGGIAITGVFNADPLINTQRVRVTLLDTETDPFVTSALSTPYTLKANKEYRHSLKRLDTGFEAVLSYGGITFLQATEP